MMSIGVSSRTDEKGKARLDFEGIADVGFGLQKAVEHSGDFIYEVGNWTLGWDHDEHKKIMEKIAEADGGRA